MSAAGHIVYAGVQLPATLVALEAQHHPASSAAEARRMAARALAIRALLVREARREGLQAAPERDAAGREETPDEALIRQLLAERVESDSCSEADCQAFYRAYPELFMSPDHYTASHILFAVPDGEPLEGDADEQALNSARQTLADLNAGRRFEDLALTRSDCPSGKSGGVLGQMETGDLVREVEAALAALEPGGIAPKPVRSAYGWHVLRLDQRAGGALLPYEHVREAIRMRIDARSWALGAAEYAERLMAASAHEGIAISLSEEGEVGAPAISLGTLMSAGPELSERIESWLAGTDPELLAAVKDAASDDGVAGLVQRASSAFVREADDSAWSTLISAAQDNDDPVLGSVRVILRRSLKPARPAVTLIRKSGP